MSTKVFLPFGIKNNNNSGSYFYFTNMYAQIHTQIIVVANDVLILT